jgi:Integrase core domain
MGTGSFDTRETARTAIFDYIEGFYNPSRRHSSIGYMSPYIAREVYRVLFSSVVVRTKPIGTTSRVVEAEIM